MPLGGHPGGFGITSRHGIGNRLVFVDRAGDVAGDGETAAAEEVHLFHEVVVDRLGAGVPGTVEQHVVERDV